MEISVLRKKVKDINDKIEKLFEDKYKGIFDEEDFSRLYLKLKEDRTKAEKDIKILKNKEENQESADEIKKVLKKFLETKEVTKLDILSLTDRIEMDQNKNIYIHYKYNLLNEENRKESL